MSFESAIQKTALASASVAGIAIGAYKGGEVLYNRDLRNRLPEDGTEQSIFPFAEVVRDLLEEEGLNAVAAGGPPKQALKDRLSTILPDTKTVVVSDGPCDTRNKATLYRPGEFTLRDDDRRVLELKVNGLWVPANPTEEIIATIYKRGQRIQQGVDEFARSLPGDFSRGPELSLFAYENPQGPFRATHYATVTRLVDPEDAKSGEIVSHSIGVERTIPYDEPWTFAVNHEGRTILYPMGNPADILGRTLIRSLVVRERDEKEVQEAETAIREAGLFNKVLGDRYMEYVALRRDMDEAFNDATVSQINAEDGLVSAIHFAIGKRLAKFAHAIENSYLGPAIRDPESPIYPFTSRIMGVPGAKYQEIEELPIEPLVA